MVTAARNILHLVGGFTNVGVNQKSSTWMAPFLSVAKIKTG